MKRCMRLLVLFGLLTSLGVSCQSANKAIASAVPGSSINWWAVWLAQPVCMPPCWQNITPGVTTVDEAVSILDNTPEIRIAAKSDKGVNWAFNQNENEGGTLGISQDGIVRMIWLGSMSDQKLFVKTIFASYNYPEYVKPYDCREGMCSTALVYSDLGLLLNVFIENTGKTNNPQIEILPDTVVNRVYFIEPGIENFRNLFEIQENDLLMDWKGFGTYP
jgi:hypothetical protein